MTGTKSSLHQSRFSRRLRFCINVVKYTLFIVRYILFRLPLPPPLRFYITVVKYILFKSSPPPPQAGNSGESLTALNGKIRLCDGQYLEVRDLLLELDSKNKKVNLMKIGGNSFSNLKEIEAFAQKQGQSDSHKPIDTADLTIDHPVLVCQAGGMANSHIAFCIYRLYSHHALLQTYGLQPEQVTVIFWSCNDNEPTQRFRAFYEKMFGGIEVEHISDKPHQKILLRQALIYAGEPGFRISPSVPALRDWMTRSFQIKVKTETHKVEKIVFIDRQPHKFRVNKLSEHTEAAGRVISNMDELCDAIQTRYPALSFIRARLELLPIPDQIALLADADIVIGVHGAGLIFAANVVPENAGIIELLPANHVLFNALFIVSGICLARGVHYDQRVQLLEERRVSKNYNERYGTLPPEKIVHYFPPKAIIRKIARITRRIEKSANLTHSS